MAAAALQVGKGAAPLQLDHASPAGQQLTMRAAAHPLACVAHTTLRCCLHGQQAESSSVPGL